MLLRGLKFITLFGLTVWLIGEIDFRFFEHTKRLEYDVDEELYWRLRPNQRGFEWMASMTRQSPLISINSFGCRGTELSNASTNVLKILAIGSSSAMGAGVNDEEVWTAQLERLTNNADNLKTLIMNCANPGWGPFQHAKLIRMEAKSYSPHMLIVMVSSKDLNFLPFESEFEKQGYLANAQKKKKIAELSPFVTFCYRKIEAVLLRLKNRWNEWLNSYLATPDARETSGARGGVLIAMFVIGSTWVNGLKSMVSH